MHVVPPDVGKLISFFTKAGRSRENAEAWAHAIIDVQESFDKIFNQLLPQAIGIKESDRDSRELLGDIREEFRHIEYHVQDVEGR